MATSSITTHVRIEGEDAVRKFVDALEQAEVKSKSIKRAPVSYRRVSGKEIVSQLAKNK